MNDLQSPHNQRLIDLFRQQRNLQFPKGQVIQASDYRQDLQLVESGFVSRYLIANDGSLKVQSIYGPGYVFPLTLVFKALFDYDIYEGPETLYYNALTDVELFSINRDQLIEAVKQDPQLYQDLLYEAGKRFHSNIQWLENASLRQPYHRIAHQLVYFAGQHSEHTPAGTKLTLPLTHQDLADILGISRETVTRQLAQLAKDGLVSDSKSIVIPDVEKLRAAAHQSD